MNNAFNVLIFTFFLMLPYPVLAVEVAPRISDREIVEGLTEIRGDIKRLDSRIDALSSKMDDNFASQRSEMNGKFADLRSEMNGKFADLRSEMNGKFADLRSEMNNRFDSLHWTLGIFITIALVILGFVLRMQWQMHRRQTQTETILGAQRDELSFIKGLIEKLMPPRGVL